MKSRALFAVFGFLTLGLSVGASPSCRAQETPTPARALLVLSNAESGLSIVDAASGKVIARVPTGTNPHEVTVSADGKTAYVANYGNQTPGSSLTVIDLAARKAVKTVNLPGLVRPHGIVEHRGKVYFTAEANEAVARYDPATDKVDWQATTGQKISHMLVVAPDGKTLYTANAASDTVTALFIPSGKTIHIPTGKGPEGISIAPDDKTVWAANRGDGTLSVIDTATHRVIKTLPAGKLPIRAAFTPDGKRVLVTDPVSGDLRVYDAAKQELEQAFPVGGGGMAIVVTPDSGTAYVALRNTGAVAVVDLKTLKVTGKIEGVGAVPDGMAWAERREGTSAG
jgi:YVTN family beta-propeller protein